MADDRSASFEGALGRLEAIVRSLESDDADLDRAVALYDEGKKLVAQCEAQLKTAQEKIDAVNAPPGAPRPAEDAAVDAL